MKSRLYVRLLIALFFFWGVVRRKFFLFFRINSNPKKILICHRLLIGDVMMLFPMIARLRKNHPQAKIYLMSDSVMKEFLSFNPYDCEVIEYDGKHISHFFSLLRRGFFDVVIIPAENKLAYLSVAVGCGDIYAYEGDKPNYKNWMINHLIPFPATKIGIPELFDQLGSNVPILTGGNERSSINDEWQLPSADSMGLPKLSRYIVIHVGARNRLRYWSADHWLEVAKALNDRGYEIIFTCAPGEASQLERMIQSPYRTFPGNLTLLQMAVLLHDASLIVCSDTGIAHMARLLNVDICVIFGQGSERLFGQHSLFKGRYVPVIKSVDCRNQKVLFRRYAPWVARCNRTYGVASGSCSNPVCINAITANDVMNELKKAQLI